MLDLVRNPEDRFSHNEAHIGIDLHVALSDKLQPFWSHLMSKKAIKITARQLLLFMLKKEKSHRDEKV